MRKLNDQGPEVQKNRDAQQSPTPPRTQREEALFRLFDRISQLSSLPSVANRVFEVADNETSSASDLLGVIESDTTLALRILRTVNSSYLGLANRVADLKSAISLLGFREVRNLALTVYVGRLFKEPGVYRKFTRDGLWNHMVAVATTARMIAKVCHKAEPEEAYLAGLLHDVGFILIDQFLRRHFISVLDRLTQDVSTVELEREILSFDHVDLGTFIARQTNFPESVIDAIQYHHEPGNYTGPNSDLVNILATANYLASREGMSSLGVHNVAPPPDAVYVGLGLQATQLAEIWDELGLALSTANALADM